MRTITAGSFSRLDTFAECQLQAKYKYIDKVPEPDRGAPPKGKTEWANDRGSRIHDHAEQFIKGKELLARELTSFSAELTAAKLLHSDGKATTEEMWCFNKKWKPIKEDDAKNTYFRIKADLTASLSDTHALIVDFKTGKRYGNEIKHEKQKQTYAIGAFLRNIKLQKVTTELWYTDLPDEDIYASVLTRSQGLFLLKSLDARMKRMTETLVFTPSPSKSTCRFCPYNGKHGEQICPHAVT